MNWWPPSAATRHYGTCRSVLTASKRDRDEFKGMEMGADMCAFKPDYPRELNRFIHLILYPEEHHEMKSYGRPDRRIDRIERILAWFDRYVR